MKHSKFLTLLLALSIADTALAQEEPPPQGWLNTVSGGYLHQTNGDLKDGGDFGLDQASLRYGLSNILPDGNVYGLALNYSWWGYNFNGTNTFGQSDPWGNITKIDLGAPLFYKLNNGWDLFAVPTLSASFESGSSLSDGITAGGIFGMSRELSDTLTVGPGIGIYSEIEDSPNIFPFFAINWKLDEFWSFETGRGLGIATGPAMYANYDLDRRIRFQFGLRYETLRFRLDEEGIAPGGAGEDKTFFFYTGVRYSPNRAMHFSAFAGSKFSGTLILDDKFGNQVHRQSYKGSFFFGTAFRLYFQ